MKKLFILCCYTALAVCSYLEAAPGNLRAIMQKETERSNIIRVRVLHEVPQIQLDVQGTYLLLNPDNNSILSRRIHGKSGTMQTLITGLKWGEEFPDLYQIKVVPTHSSTEIRLDNRPYSGSVSFYDVGNTISVVNDLLVEDYIADLLANALTGDEPQEAVNALAIAARSSAYFQVQHPRNPYWDLDGTTVGYPGKGATPASIAKVQQALRATRQMMLTQPTGILNDAFNAPWTTAVAPEASKKTGLLTLQAAIEGANQGLHAAQILHATFPTAILQRVAPQS